MKNSLNSLNSNEVKWTLEEKYKLVDYIFRKAYEGLTKEIELFEGKKPSQVFKKKLGPFIKI